MRQLTGIGENSLRCFAILYVDSNLNSSATFSNDLFVPDVGNRLCPLLSSRKGCFTLRILLQTVYCGTPYYVLMSHWRPPTSCKSKIAARLSFGTCIAFLAQNMFPTCSVHRMGLQ